MPSPSRDGKRLAYRGGTQRAPEIRLRDLAANTDVRLAEAAGFTYLVLSPDGSTVAFSADRVGAELDLRGAGHGRRAEEDL